MSKKNAQLKAEHRSRQAIIAHLEVLMEGDNAFDWVSVADYFGAFYKAAPCVPREASGNGARPGGVVITEEEIGRIENVREMLDQASHAADASMSEEDFIATGWPERIRPVAHSALRALKPAPDAADTAQMPRLTIPPISPER